MHEQIELNQERIENKLSMMNLDYINLSDRVMKNNNNYKDLDRRFENVLETVIPNRIGAEMSVVVDDYKKGHQQVTNRLVVVEYTIEDILAKRDTIPAVVEERLTELSLKIEKLGDIKPAAPMPKTDEASDSARPPTPPVWKVDNSMGSVTMRRGSSTGKARGSSASNDSKGRPSRAKKKTKNKVKSDDDPDDSDPESSDSFKDSLPDDDDNSEPSEDDEEF